MENIIELKGHCKSPWNRRLIQIKDSDLYKVDNSLKECPTESGYLRIGSDSKDYNKINFIDFDGGPFLAIGYNVGNYTISEFILTEDNDVLVRLG